MFNIPFITKKGSNPDSDNSESLHAKNFKFKNFLVWLYQVIWRFVPVKLLYRWKIKDKYDVEISYLEGICSKIIGASSNKKSMKLAWIHVDLMDENKSSKFFKTYADEKKCYENFDKVVGVSQLVSYNFIKKFNFDKDKVTTIYNCIDDKEIKYKAKLKDNVYKDDTNFKICTVGRLAFQKGYDRLIEAVDRLRKESYKFKIYIIGEGPERQKLKEEIDSRDLNGYISLLGFIDNPYPYLNEADLFISSSRSEGFSTAAIEASILKKVSVVTDVSGMRELFGDSEYGMVVENSVEGIYTGLKKILSDKRLFEIYEEKICEVSSNFNLKKNLYSVEKSLS